jgi:hypothetical protein
VEGLLTGLLDEKLIYQEIRSRWALYGAFHTVTAKQPKPGKSGRRPDIGVWQNLHEIQLSNAKPQIRKVLVVSLSSNLVGTMEPRFWKSLFLLGCC